MKNTVKSLSLTLVLCLITALLSGCSPDSVTVGSTKSETVAESSAVIASDADSAIVLNGDSASFNGGGVSINGSEITIGATGTYTVTGTLNNGRIVVNTGEDAMDVTLVLNNADITCLEDSAIYVAQAKNCYLVLAEGSTNAVTSGTESQLTDHDELANGAAIFAEDDLEISGSGTLNICGYINNGITGKDDVVIQSGTIAVTAANNGIRGSESVVMNNGALTIDAANDGMKATSATKEGKGFVEVNGGSIAIRCSGDGLQAETTLTVNGGTLDIVTHGDTALTSSKALKGKQAVVIAGGDLNLTATDNGIQSSALVELTGGNVILSSGNDGIRCGEKSTGFTQPTGTVNLRGGSLSISAVGDPVDARASFLISGGSLLGVGGAAKIKSPAAESTQSWFTAKLSGSTDTDVTAAGLTVSSSCAFTYVLCTDASLVAGSAVTVTAGSTSMDATVQ